jgi:hypothetical protein
MFLVFIKNVCLFLLIKLNNPSMKENLKKKRIIKIVLSVLTFNVLTNSITLLTYI